MKHQQKIRWKPKVNQGTFSLFYYMAWLLDGHEQVMVNQIADKPPESTDKNSSLLIFHLDESGENGIGFHITWWPYKPLETSPARRAGLLAVLKDIANKMPEDVREWFMGGMLGIGHAYGAQAVINEEEGDDETP